jgi:hypothetical protein
MYAMKVFSSILIALLVFGFNSASAANVTLSFSSPLKVGQETSVTANVSDASGLEGAVLSVIFDGAQNAQAVQVDLGKIGDPKLEGKFTPTGEVRRVTVRYSANGKNYANVADLKDVQSNAYEFRFDQEKSRASTPIIQFGLWLVVFAALGAFALRNAKGAF